MTRTSIARRGPNRRSILKGATAFGGAALVLPMGSRMGRAQPSRGGILRTGTAHGSTTDSLDPGTWENDFMIQLAHMRNNFLTEIAADGSLVPEIAESWEASDDASEWTFAIRAGVPYHSGRTVTAEDVVASLNHHRGEDSTSAAAPILADITDIRADGMNVIVTLASGNADFPFILSDYHLAILPATDGAIDPRTTDGCGPYVLDELELGVSASLTRFDGYWKPDAAWFDGIELISIIDPAARQNALISGEVDYIDQVDLNTVNLLRRSPGIEVLSVAGTQHYGLPMDTRAAPFSDNNIRLALKYAIDRQQMVDTILNGYGAIGNDHPIGSGQRFFNTELEQKTFDPDRARFHLKEAGLDSLDVDIHLADAAFAGALDAGVLFSETAGRAGINLNVVREPNDGYWSNVWMQKPFVGTYWGGRPTEDQMFTTAYATGAPWNESYWSNERFDELLVAARSELDEDLRREMYFELQELVSDQGGTIIPMFASYVGAHTDRLQHGEDVATNWANDGHRMCERWWFS
ncbi:ABC transporter substrate-binding protein [Jannaschia formosa]|uniref:ABC transporter substrate-binding protein n=1 Tax=Jannaschia formosa TaxID=2259592 RepID=UPI000E1C0939|nr:ABC transporter substrate-binding protein [Jannaschia formosa]TFL18487.1 ABC transporter substrate-binding protein [Jannaschia formosa]